MTKQWKLKSALVAGVAALATTAVDAKQYSVAAAGRETCRGEHCEQRRIDRRCRQQLVQLVVEQLVELQFEFVQQFEFEFVLQQLVELELQLFEQLQLEFFVEQLRPRLALSPLGAGEKERGPDHPAPAFCCQKKRIV